jgi:hypothetical protein
MDPFGFDITDIDYPRAILLLLLVVSNITIISAVGTSEVAYGPYNSNWGGTTELRTIADEQSEVTVAHETSVYETASADTVALVIAPQEAYGPTDLAQLRQFVQRGGTLVVVSGDNRTNTLLAALEIDARIDGGLLRDEQENYRNASLPVATNVVDHRYTEGVSGLTLNYGSAINVSDADANAGLVSQSEGAWQGTYLVNSSRFAYIDRNRNEALDTDEEMAERPVAVAESVGSGTVVVVSDASVITNAMVERDGNRQFIENLLASHGRVLLDHSHSYPLPPLMYVLLAIRSAPILQFIIGLGTVTLVALWARGWMSRLKWRRWVPIETRPHGPSDAVGRLSSEELTAFLSAEHPDWESDRVERVTEAIIRRRGKSEDND